jgi:hypothetical protein
MAADRATPTLLALAMFLTSASAVSAPSDQASRFREWATGAAKRAHLVVCRWGAARYDGQPTEANFAMFRQGRRAAVVLAWGEEGRAYRSDDDVLHQVECPGETAPPAWETVSAFKFPEMGQRPKETSTIALVDGDLVLLDQHEEDHSFSSVVDWVGLEENHINFDPASEHAAAIFPLLAPGSPWLAKLPKPRNWVTFSRVPHGGPADAAVDARISLVGTDLRIELGATDDVFLAPANAKTSDRDFLRRDHFELWFCAAGEARSCDKKTARQLGVAKTADGKVHARWLLPKGNKDKLPEVTLAEDSRPGIKLAVVVTLPLNLIGHAGELTDALEGKLTVAYSDADLAAQGQKALVATSDLRWGAGESFGRFVRQADGGRFPLWSGSGAFERDIEFLASLPKLPGN